MQIKEILPVELNSVWTFLILFVVVGFILSTLLAFMFCLLLSLMSQLLFGNGCDID